MRSRWGWWLVAVGEDFQRQRAAALVSANRQASGGDSTGPSPNHLALVKIAAKGMKSCACLAKTGSNLIQI